MPKVDSAFRHELEKLGFEIIKEGRLIVPKSRTVTWIECKELGAREYHIPYCVECDVRREGEKPSLSDRERIYICLNRYLVFDTLMYFGNTLGKLAWNFSHAGEVSERIGVFTGEMKKHSSYEDY